MARFQGNVHAGSDRLAATVLVILLIIALLLLAWFVNDRAGWDLFWSNLFAGLRR